jgi:hypothetical protein
MTSAPDKHSPLTPPLNTNAITLALALHHTTLYATTKVCTSMSMCLSGTLAAVSKPCIRGARLALITWFYTPTRKTSVLPKDFS